MSSQNHKKTSLLSKWLEKNKKKDDDAINRRQNKNFAPLSDAQKRLWLLQHLYPNNPFYNVIDKNVIKGNLDLGALIECINRVVKENESLRTNFIIHNDEILQQIKDFQEVDVIIKDFIEFDDSHSILKSNDFIDSESLKSFNLENDTLLRIIICKISKNQHLLFFIMHHIVVDLWSMKLIREQIYKNYISLTTSESSRVNSSTIQFGDYTSWFKQRVDNEKQIKYWKTKLSGELNTLDLPYDYSRPLMPSFKGSLSTKKLQNNIYAKLKKFSQLKNTTQFVTLLTVFKILLYKYSSQKDVIVGIPITTRDRKELESVIGFFDETIPLRSDISGKLSFSGALDIVKQTTSEAFSNKDISFETIVKTVNPERSLSINPIFQVMFIYNKDEPMSLENENLEWHNEVFDYKVSKFDLTLYVSESDDGISVSFEYSHDLFEEATIERMLNHFENILKQSLENPDLKVQDLSILSESEENELINICRNNELPIIATEVTQIQHLFENEAIKNPDKTAVISNDNDYSYSYINRKSNSLAIHLHSSGVKINERVGLCISRSVDMIIGIFGILKAGASYVPIAVDAPQERIAFMIKDADIAQVIVDDKSLHLFEDEKLQLHRLENLNDDESDFSNSKLSEKSNLAYTLYTSGSTGKPKGVTITHSNLIYSTTSRFSFYKEQPERFLLLSAFTFDSSVAGIFWTLSTGNTLIIPEKRIEQDLNKLGDLIKKHQVTHTLLLPTLYKVILEHINKEDLDSLKTVIIAGEECSIKVSQLHFNTLPTVSLFNEYGPTEATVWAIAHRVKVTDNTLIPIGKPIPNVKLYVLDNDLNLVPKGVKGELYIGGPNIALGYLNNDSLTEEHFIQNPFNTKTKDVLYKTGDLVKINSHHNFEFHGRTDNQVKLRGYRIELDEISRTIQQFPSIKEVVTKLEEQNFFQSELEELDFKLNQLEEQEALKLLDYISKIEENELNVLGVKAK
jgi:amino acid adenylation domain-containing protein